jgi:biopolymer transport protein ExbB/TolQ
MNQRIGQRGSARGLFLIAITVSAAALIGLSFTRGEGLVETLARVITRFVVPVNAVILFAFTVIVSLVIGIFLHYFLFELKDALMFDDARAKRLAQAYGAADKPALERVGTMRGIVADDETLFGQIMRRFLGENGLSSERPNQVWQGLQDEEFDRVKRNLMYFSLASVLSPALGFLGTAVGMVSAFYEISVKDHVTPADLATSIQIALITTVIGLVIKTVAMMLKTMVIHSIERREDQMTLAFQRLFER